MIMTQRIFFIYNFIRVTSYYRGGALFFFRWIEYYDFFYKNVKKSLYIFLENSKFVDFIQKL